MIGIIYWSRPIKHYKSYEEILNLTKNKENAN